jgi:hypothetical protein
MTTATSVVLMFWSIVSLCGSVAAGRYLVHMLEPHEERRSKYTRHDYVAATLFALMGLITSACTLWFFVVWPP